MVIKCCVIDSGVFSFSKSLSDCCLNCYQRAVWCLFPSASQCLGAIFSRAVLIVERIATSIPNRLFDASARYSSGECVFLSLLLSSSSFHRLLGGARRTSPLGMLGALVALSQTFLWLGALKRLSLVCFLSQIVPSSFGLTPLPRSSF